MNYESDVAIVGAGPAGSTAAYVLAKLGLNVIIIDKSSFQEISYVVAFYPQNQ